MDTHIGLRIRAAREAAGLSCQGLARLAGIDESSLRRVEGGQRPSVDRADDILRALGCRLTLGDPAAAELPDVAPERRRRAS